MGQVTYLGLLTTMATTDEREGLPDLARKENKGQTDKERNKRKIGTRDHVGLWLGIKAELGLKFP